jgi:hypothetical protein
MELRSMASAMSEYGGEGSVQPDGGDIRLLRLRKHFHDDYDKVPMEHYNCPYDLRQTPRRSWLVSL